MFIVTVLSFFFLIVFEGFAELSSPECDFSRKIVSKEGPMGETQTFSWLGILRVHLYHDKQLRIALTGIVLIQEGYAIANADDVARIPKRIFKEDSRAMFIPLDEIPIYIKTLDYVTHPEYKFQTLSTVALIELDPGDLSPFPIRPVCWPLRSFVASNHLYTVGFTDENQSLEKFIYKLEYIGPNLCREFYSRAGLTERMVTPTHSQCGLALNKEKACVWDNGMAFVSNATGYWILIGLGLFGPGCAAPSRYIDLEYYYGWIEAEINTQKSGDLRKSGLSHQKMEIEDVPAHELLRAGDKYDLIRDKKNMSSYFKYPYHAEMYEDKWLITHVDKAVIIIHNLKLNTIGTCELPSLRLVYRDITAVEAVTVLKHKMELKKLGIASYKVSLSDLNFLVDTCIQIKVRSLTDGVASITYTYKMEKERFEPETLDEIIKYYPITKLYETTTRRSFNLANNPHMKKQLIVDTADPRDDMTINIFLKVYFEGKAEMEVKIFGIRKPKHEITRFTSTTGKPMRRFRKPAKLNNNSLLPSTKMLLNTKTAKLATQAYLRNKMNQNENESTSDETNQGSRSSAGLLVFVIFLLTFYSCISYIYYPIIG